MGKRIARKNRDAVWHEILKVSAPVVIRTLAGKPNLSVGCAHQVNREDSNQNFQNSVTLQTPPLVRLSLAARNAFRGNADREALPHRFHDEKLYRKTQPVDTKARTICDFAERERLFAVAGKKWSGVGVNIRQSEEERLKRLFPVDVRSRNLFYEGLALKIRADLNGIRYLSPSAKKVLSLCRAEMAILDQKLTDNGFKGFKSLKPYIGDQAAFSKQLSKILNAAGYDMSPREEQKEKPENSQDNEEDGNSDANSSGEPQDTSEQQTENEENSASAARKQGVPARRTGGKKQHTPTGIGSGNGYPSRHPKPPISLLKEFQYTAYTTEFDRVVDMGREFDQNDKDYYTMRLEALIQGHYKHARALARQWHKKLMAQQYLDLLASYEEGAYLDSNGLAQKIADPMSETRYRSYAPAKYKDTIVSLMIDCSGSMRNNRIEAAAASVYLLAMSLEMAGIKTEILGYTTSDYRGGESYKLWKHFGCPSNPGRMNDLRHLVFKSADDPWRRARKNIGLALHEPIHGENIDGEALLWQYRRLQNRPESRKIMMLFCDGDPVCDRTINKNCNAFLPRHLHQVVHWLESQRNVELLAFGIFHDVTQYFKNGVVINDLNALPSVTIHATNALLDGVNFAYKPDLQKIRFPLTGIRHALHPQPGQSGIKYRSTKHEPENELPVPAYSG